MSRTPLVPLAAGFRADPPLTVDAWADAHRILTTAETARPGQWRTQPFQVEPLRRLSSDDPCQRVVLMLPAQVAGKTEIGLNWIGYTIDVSPCPIMMLEPTLADAETVSKQRIKHLVECQTLRGKVADPRSRDSGNTLLIKEAPGMVLYLAGANSPAGLAGKPMGRLIADEVDRYPESAGTEGDPLALARKRLSSWGPRAKELVISTPTVAEHSRIETEYNASTRGRWAVPCPHCGAYQPLEWGTPETHGLRWTIDADGQVVEAWYECRACHARIEETRKGAMLTAGRWEHEHPDRPAWGGHMTALSAPVGSVTWPSLVREWLDATARAKVGDTSLLRVFINTRLAETWEDRGEQVDATTVQSRVETFDAQALPERVRAVTIGVDVQDDRLELEVVAWAAGMESWSLGYYVIATDPLDAETWTALDAIRAATYRTVDGRILRAAVCCVDSGYRTQAVYDYAARHKRGVFAVKGNDGAKTIWEAKVRKGGRNKDRGRFHLVGTNTAKDAVAAYFRVSQPGPGYCHVPTEREPSWFEGLVAESRKRITVQGKAVWVWRKRAEHLRNEPLDCRVYALAGVHCLLAAGVRLGDPVPVQPSEPSSMPVTEAKVIPVPSLDNPPAPRHDVGARRVSRQGLEGSEDW